MDDPLGADEAVGHFLDLGALALDNNDLHTQVMVQVDVQARDDGLAHFVLDVSQRVGQFPDVVIVDEGDRTDGLLIGLPLALYKVVPDKIPERL